MSSIFTKIIEGEIPCHKVAENEYCLAFMDINPVAEGHVLVVPKIEVDYFFDLSDETLARLMQFAKPIAKAIEAEVPCQRIGVTVLGLEVPHAHVHLVPLDERGLISFRKKFKTDHEQLAALAAKIAARLE